VFKARTFVLLVGQTLVRPPPLPIELPSHKSWNETHLTMISRHAKLICYISVSLNS